MRRVSTALIAALLLPATAPLLLGTATSTGALLVIQAPAQAQSSEAVAKAAQAITVRIEGATQGSGVLVKRDGNRYTVLSAWHVVSGQRPGEELDIYTPDGQRHKVEQGSIKRLGEVDMAVLNFSSSNSYELARVGDVKSVSSGSGIYVAGFPLPTSTVPTRIWRFLDGKVIANATVAIPNGYQLLYSNQTLPGMSGGAVLNAQGQLVGIHASAERADQISERSGKAVATGTNQAVPVAYYSMYSKGEAVVASSSQASTADDYLVQAKSLLGEKGREREIIRLSNQVLSTRNSAEAYFYRAFAKDKLGDKQGAIDDYSQSILLEPQNSNGYTNRALLRISFLDDKRGGMADLNKAIGLDPRNAVSRYNLGKLKDLLGDTKGAISDLSRAIIINPGFIQAYHMRGNVKIKLGDYQGAIVDLSRVIAMDPQSANGWGALGLAKYKLGDKYGGCEDTRRSAFLGSPYAQKLLPEFCK